MGTPEGDGHIHGFIENLEAERAVGPAPSPHRPPRTCRGPRRCCTRGSSTPSPWRWASPFRGAGPLPPRALQATSAVTRRWRPRCARSPVAVGVGSLVASLLLYPLFLLAGVGIVHLVAMLFGAAKNGYERRHGGRSAARPARTSSASFPASASWPAPWCWAIFGISSLQETSTGKAAGGGRLALLICCCGPLSQSSSPPSAVGGGRGHALALMTLH